MSSGFLDFFILEASEYVEQLDGLLARASATNAPVDTETLARNARALRGSATMAKLRPFAELSTALERVGRGLREGTVAWSPAIAGALVAAVDDLKILIRAVRNWSIGDDQRAAARTAELTRIAPAVTPAAPTAAAAAGSGSGFFVAESSNIAAGLELLATRPNDRDAATNVLRRVRALRGVAGIKDVAPLADVMAGAELVAKPLELGQGPLDADRIVFLRASAALLRRAAGAMREGKPADAPSPERDAFVEALSKFEAREQNAARIVPITQLFYADGGPHVVSASPNPPTTPAERFRLEVVSQGEHLRGLVAEARRNDPAAADRLRRELRHALASLKSDAESFAESEIAELIGAHFDAVKSLDYLSLNALETLAQALASPGAQGEHLASRLAELKIGRSVDAGIGDAFSATPAQQPAPTATESAAPPAPPTRQAAPPSAPPLTPASFSTAPTPVITPRIRADASMATPLMPPHAAVAPQPAAPTTTPPVIPTPRASGSRSHTPIGAHRVSTPRDTMAVLDQGIDSLSSIAAQPMSEPVELPEQPLVPIDALLYRGRAAIERAIELREEIRRQGGSASDDTMAELFDLLDLALAE
ncbi:MAG TPA: Hpt domain-containing protein [Gemmatimonadaceae bacterium]|jgi:chemotaxis protein histidine kinase CheA